MNSTSLLAVAAKLVTEGQKEHIAGNYYYAFTLYAASLTCFRNARNRKYIYFYSPFFKKKRIYVF